ncbi:ABC transporter ATP-binding protein [Parendozoicomonas haliclonae]|uniref:Ribose import ATP-binding protein RbsA n=1 Tax=Parendozoicomonas haliclonae TaxID=1960125 RepID=A0A1X7AKZ9_9GAMM|nr:ABC transporter ATP-binding protein [Parendozoicomonas haliclonae]SMA48489.1 Ribose import ATP-binding protein RbsA [Parendozoicomonas haliclonae]
MTPAIELSSINKQFGPVWANRDIDLKIMPGTIHGIVGENGAGKSTLMSILYGFYTADSGDIHVNGRKVTIRNSHHAIDLGIGMVHQHFMLVETFTVLENIMLGMEGGSLLFKARSRARKALEEITEKYGLNVDPDALVGELPVGLQQRVEILKALYRGAKVLILDEPTSVLTPQETGQLFEILRTLRSQGVTVLIITHKLKEIMAITDNVSVMRGGCMVAHRQTSETSTTELAELMVGRTVLLQVDKEVAVPGRTRLKVEGLSYTDERGVKRLKDVSFHVRAGEILGLAGVTGNGQSELMKVLAGSLPQDSGSFTLDTSNGVYTFNVNDYRDAAMMRDCSVGHVPENRLVQGVVKSFPASENAILGYQNKEEYGSPLLDPAKIVAATEEMMEAYDVRPRLPGLKTANFSGGNQQKLVLAREMMKEPELLLIGQPTRGVDIGAIEAIHRNLIDARDKGAAVLLVSVELDEIMSLSDRIIVMNDGMITGEVNAADTNEMELGLLMTSTNRKDDEAMATAVETPKAEAVA